MRCHLFSLIVVLNLIQSIASTVKDTPLSQSPTIDHSLILSHLRNGLFLSPTTVLPSQNSYSPVSTILSTPSQGSYSVGDIYTIAGNGAFSGIGNGGLAVNSLMIPTDTDSDLLGNTYICDAGHNMIRLVNSTGYISAFAGNGNSAYSGDGGPATEASLSGPGSLAIFNSNTLYIADTGNNCVRSVFNGIINTYAGNCTQGGFSGDGGLAVDALMQYPVGVAVAANGDLFIADTHNNRIRMVQASTGIISTVVGTGATGYSGDGLATQVSIWNPYSVSVDQLGGLFITDTLNGLIRYLNSSSQYLSTVAGTPASMGYSGDGGPATAAQLYYPVGVAAALSPLSPSLSSPYLSNSSFFIADYFNNVIRFVDGSSGSILTFAGNHESGFAGDGGAASQAEFRNPPMVDVDRYSGNVLISDANNNRVRTINLQSADLVIHTTAGVTGLIGNNGAAGAAYFNQISGLFAAPSGLYYLADPGNNQIYQVDEQSGQISVIAGNSFSGYNGNNLRALDANLNGPSYAQPDPFSSHPSSPANLLISDTNNNCIRLLNYSSPSEPVLSSLVGMCGSNGGYNGENTLPSATLLNAPTATAINPSTGDIVIVGSLNYCLRLYSRSSSGLVSTLAGQCGTSGSGPGGVSATSARFGVLQGATFDFTGQSLYFTDVTNSYIWRMDLGTGFVFIAAGNGVTGYSGDGGLATDASLSAPYSISFDKKNNLYLSGSGNNVIRRVSSSTGIITTIAGDGYPGYTGDGSSALSAELRSPQGLGMDLKGEVLYIVDTGNQRVRVMNVTELSTPSPTLSPTSIRQSGLIGTVAGQGAYLDSGNGGPAKHATLNPVSLVYGPSAWDNVFVVDSDGCRVWCVNVSSPSNPGPSIAKTIAGTGQPGFSGDGGLATLATLSYPSGVAWRFFSQASQTVLMFIADTSNNAIRLVNLETGLITLYAGNSDGKPGSSGDGGLSTAAYLNGPVGLALDSTGNLYIADSFNALIRMVNAQSMVISTVAGHVSSGNSYYFYNSNPPDNNVPQNALSATLNLPSGLAFDSEDNLYIADTSNNCIRVLSLLTGNITRFAGNCSESFPPLSPLNQPQGLTYSSASSSMFIADSGNNCIQSASTLGVPSKILSGSDLSSPLSPVSGSCSPSSHGFSGDNGPALSAQLDNPEALSFSPTGALYIADSNNERVRVISSPSNPSDPSAYTSSPISLFAGITGLIGNEGPSLSAFLSQPTGIVYDENTGLYYVADAGYNQIYSVNPFNESDADLSTGAQYTGQISVIAGTSFPGFNGNDQSALSAQLNQPTGLTVQYTSTFNVSTGVAEDYSSLFLADSLNNCIRMISPLSYYSSSFYPDSSSPSSPSSPSPFISLVAGQCGYFGYTGDGGQASQALLSGPLGVLYIDQYSGSQYSGCLFIADSKNNVIRLVSPSGIISTFAGNGQGQAGYEGDGGLAAQAYLNLPSGVAVHPLSQEVFIADTKNNKIRVVYSDGTINTIVGTGVAGYSGDGLSPLSAMLNLPRDVTLSPDPYGSGNSQLLMFISDTQNNVIRQVNLDYNGSLSAASMITTLAGTGNKGFSGDDEYGGYAIYNTLTTPVGLAALPTPLMAVQRRERRERTRRRALTNEISTTSSSSSSSSTTSSSSSPAPTSPPSPQVWLGAGGVLVTDTGNMRVRVILPEAIVTDDYPVPPPTTSSSSSPSSLILSPGALAGAIIGSILGAALLFGLFYYLFQGKLLSNKSSMNSPLVDDGGIEKTNPLNNKPGHHHL